ncbi:MAG: sigma-70 family RNA polymerase sigma factor [Planctomycetales bacterium]|nr:sigma-70 family RNA polymerase sigma factor [Planctomycetales bacterium]
MSELTNLIRSFGQGEQISDDDFAELYRELRQIAKRTLRSGEPNESLQVTALAHEAFLRLTGKPCDWSSRDHFSAYVRKAMRHIMVDRARQKAAEYRGGGYQRLETDCEQLWLDRPAEVLAIDHALHVVSEIDEQAARIVELRYFMGMTIREAADAAGVSVRTANRLWAYARALLRKELSETGK